MDRISDWPQQIAHFLSGATLQIGASHYSAWNILGLVFVLAGTWWAARLLERAIIRILRPRLATQGAFSAGYAIGRLVRYSAWIIASLVGLQLVGLNLSNLAIIGGALGVGIGFGLQGIVANFVSGIVLLIERSLKVGDFVDLASGVRGTVTEIAVRYTRVTTNADVDVIVPNSEFTTARVTNWTLDNRHRRINVPFSVAYGSDKNLVREAALAAAATVPSTMTDDVHRTTVWFCKFGASALEFELVVWIGADAVNRPGSTLSAYLWALDDALRARGLVVPFPQRDVHLRTSDLQHKLSADR